MYNVKHYSNVKINSISYNAMQKRFACDLQGFPFLMFIKVDDIKCGGENGQFQTLSEGHKISFDWDGMEAIRTVWNVIIED